MNDYFLLLSAIFRPPVPSLNGLSSIEKNVERLKKRGFTQIMLELDLLGE